MKKKILVINPGSTSTKISLFKDEEEKLTKTINHKIEELARFNSASEQDKFRMEFILNYIEKKEINLTEIDAVVGRGGLLKPIPGGTYLVNEIMLRDLRGGRLGDHSSNCGGLIAYAISRVIGCPAYIVDPVVVDEFDPVARISGMPLISRKSIFHALNQKAVAREIAIILGKKYNETNLIIAHLGGGITVGCHSRGRVIDVNNGLDGDGPFSPERCGAVPVGDLVSVCFSGKYTYKEMKKLIKGHGGMVAYLGTNDVHEVERRAQRGNEKHKVIYEAMAYQVSKEIGALATVVDGKVDAIGLTGGIAYSEYFINMVKARCQFIAPIYILPGEQEMRALALGTLRVLNGEEEAREYT
jgi:butyrate kinase